MFSSHNSDPNRPTQSHRVDSYPSTVNVLCDHVATAKARRGVKHQFFWEQETPGTNHTKKMTLSIFCSLDGKFEWWMHEEPTYGGNAKMLWFHRTDDLSLIYPEILNSVGASDQLRMGVQDGAQKQQRQKFGSLGERFGKRGATMEGTPPIPAAEMLVEEAPPSAPGIASMMTGNLRTRSISTLITTAAQHEATGHLFVEGPGERVVVQFGLGKPLHAVSMIRYGLEALMELFTWPDGECSFYEGLQPDSASIHESPEQLLKLGEQYEKDIKFLLKHKLDECSILLRPPGIVPEEQFEKRLLEGRLGLPGQKDVYDNIYGSLTLEQIATKLQLGQSRWMAIAVNLLRLGLVLTPEGKSLENAPEESATRSSTVGGFKTTDHQVTASFKLDGQEMSAPIPSMGWSSPNTPNTPSATTSTIPTKEFNGEKSGSFYTQESSGSYKRPEGLSKLSSPGNATPTRPGDWQGAASGDGKSSVPPPMPPQFLFNRPGTDEQEVTAVSGVRKRSIVCDVGVPGVETVFDSAGSANVHTGLIRQDTEIYTFDAVQYLLEREFARAFRFSSIFSLMVFCIRLGTNISLDQPAVLPTSAVHKITSAINDTKRDVDVFGHFGERTFALILPHVAASQAGALVDRIIKDLPERAPELAEFRPAFHFGIASVPQDKQDITALVAAAQQAMFEAVRRNLARVEFGELAGIAQGAPLSAPPSAPPGTPSMDPPGTPPGVPPTS